MISIILVGSFIYFTQFIHVFVYSIMCLFNIEHFGVLQEAPQRLFCYRHVAERHHYWDNKTDIWNFTDKHYLWTLLE